MLHGRGINEEDSAISTRRSGALSMSSGATRSGPVRFNVMDSKVCYFVLFEYPCIFIFIDAEHWHRRDGGQLR